MKVGRESCPAEDCPQRHDIEPPVTMPAGSSRKSLRIVTLRPYSADEGWPAAAVMAGSGAATADEGAAAPDALEPEHGARAGFEPARGVPRPHAGVVRALVPFADRSAAAGLASAAGRRVDAAAGADGQRQDAGGVPAAIDRLMFGTPPRREGARGADARCRVLYVSPLKALAVDVERNLRAPLAGITGLAAAQGIPHAVPSVAIRTGDTPPRDRARFGREAADILITTPESLYLLLTSNARERLRGRDRHHRRDPRARADQARRPPRPVAGAPRGAGGPAPRSASACRRRSGRSTRSRASSAASSRRLTRTVP